MLNIFIDTNIFLNFYSLSKVDLEELKKLIKLINDEEVKLFLTENVKDEYYKNRLRIINDTIKQFESEDHFAIPSIVLQYDPQDDILKFRKQLSEVKKDILEKLKDDALSNKLLADKTIENIFDVSSLIPTSKDVIDAAIIREFRKLPPRKQKEIQSIGDAINWESLKKEIPSEDLHIISEDGDFRDIWGKNSPASCFLLREWNIDKNAQLHIYKNLDEFFALNFKEYDFSIDKEKRKKIDRLINSPSFETTHFAIFNLRAYSSADFSIADVNQIMDAYLNNSQIYWIRKDPDVKDFFERITTGKDILINKELYKQLHKDIFDDSPEIIEENNFTFEEFSDSLNALDQEDPILHDQETPKD